jgi:spermidine synthase
VYAWSTAGAIAGTFLTGWWLISLLGVSTLTLVAGLGLLAMAVWIGRFWQYLPALVAAIVLTGGTLYALQVRDALTSPCTSETNYFCIKVYADVRDGREVKVLVLDHLIHSYVELGNPAYLGYEHEIVQAEVTHLVAERHPAPRVLLIGGGGYTYPRWVEAFIPGATMEVVEIDPGVTEVAYKYLGLPADTSIISFNMDGRQFVQEIAQPGQYHVIVQDAVNDLSVPYHLLTREYNDHIRRLLVDDGVYLVSIIDLFDDGQLLRAAIRTMKETFPSVQLLGPGPVWAPGGSAVFVIAGSDQPIDLVELRRVLGERGAPPMRTVALRDERLREYVAQGPQIILTDQYAPVDNLISILFERRR